MRISKCLALWALALLAVPTSVDAQGWKNPGGDVGAAEL